MRLLSPWVTAPSTPIERPPGVRPVSLLAARMVTRSGTSTTSAPAGAPSSWSRCLPIRRLKKSWPSSTSKSKAWAFCTKKGRFSRKHVSKAVRFTTVGSTSTWPKEGFTVASTLKLGPRPKRASSPTSSPVSVPSKNGFDDSAGALTRSGDTRAPAPGIVAPPPPRR